VLVDAWAPWCGPCLKLGPTIEELAEEYEGRAVVGKLNVDEASDIARQYNISSIPALLFFRNGKEVDRIEGIQPKAEIAARLDLLIGQ
jgi:thioredoxin 1